MKTLSLMIVAGLLCATGSFGFATHAVGCDPKQAGATVDCPIFTEPAFTSVPNAPMGGTVIINAGTNLLFGGVVPPNGFMVQINLITGTDCWVTDNGPGGQANGFHLGGFIGPNIMGPALFVTPPGYKPMGPVSVYCTGGILMEVRGW